MNFNCDYGSRAVKREALDLIFAVVKAQFDIFYYISIIWLMDVRQRNHL